MIEGHTDSTGNPDYNRKLSEKRASAVRDVMVATYGVDPNELAVTAWARTEPLPDIAPTTRKQAVSSGRPIGGKPAIRVPAAAGPDRLRKRHASLYTVLVRSNHAEPPRPFLRSFDARNRMPIRNPLRRLFSQGLLQPWFCRPAVHPQTRGRRSTRPISALRQARSRKRFVRRTLEKVGNAPKEKLLVELVAFRWVGMTLRS